MISPASSAAIALVTLMAQTPNGLMVKRTLGITRIGASKVLIAVTTKAITVGPICLHLGKPNTVLFASGEVHRYEVS